MTVCSPSLATIAAHAVHVAVVPDPTAAAVASVVPARVYRWFVALDTTFREESSPATDPPSPHASARFVCVRAMKAHAYESTANFDSPPLYPRRDRDRD